jgi:hypothetical protein
MNSTNVYRALVSLLFCLSAVCAQQPPSPNISEENRRTSNGRAGNLANSNERGEKGFVPTSELGRTFGPVGKYKLDWIFVSPPRLTEPHGIKQPSRFAPHFGRTLKELNDSIPGRVSDHNPILVDLPLQEPALPTK